MSAIPLDTGIDNDLDPLFADHLRDESLSCRFCSRPLPASKEISVCGQCSNRKTLPIKLSDKGLLAEARAIREARGEREIEEGAEAPQRESGEEKLVRLITASTFGNGRKPEAEMICKCCLKKFKTKNISKVYCSKECYHVAVNKAVTSANCKQCGNLIEFPPNRPRMFCNQECIQKWNSRPKEIRDNCTYCGERITHKDQTLRNYCSYACQKTHKGNTKAVIAANTKRREPVSAQKEITTSNPKPARSTKPVAVEPVVAAVETVAVTEVPAPAPMAVEPIKPGTSVELVSVTPEQASDLLKLNYKNQRPLRRHHVEYLANEMRAGRFISGTQIHLANLQDDYHLVNGQHTLSAIVLSGCAILLSIQITDCENEQAVADLYTYHDIGLKRTLSDAFAAQDLSTKTGLKAREVKFLAYGVRNILAGFTPGNRNYSITRNDTLKAVIEWQDAGREFYAAIAGCSNPMKAFIERSSVMSVALVTFRYQPEKARIFWGTLAADDGLRNGTTIKTLRDRLFAVRLKSGADKNGEKVTESYLSRMVASAWNAFTEGRELAQFNVKHAHEPIKINLTPYGE